MAPPAARLSEPSDHANKVRMLVLETDETHPDTQEEKGGFGEVLNELLVDAGNSHTPKLGIETMMQYIVEPEGGQIPKKEEIGDDVHAILITGSEWDAHGDDAWILELVELIRRESTSFE
jgi:GMP synthase-like glutamine amidotransferase